jgi:hypothetical protein
MELVWSQPGFKPVNEPLCLKVENTSEKRKSGISGFEELYSEKARAKVIDYFKGFVNGKYHYRNPFPLHKYARFFTSRIVFKVIHGGEFFINDIAKETNSKIVYLIRNPIAVSLSRKQIPRTQELTSDFVMSKFTPKQQKLAKHIIIYGTDMEKKIMLWCIQNKLALSQRTSDWLVVFYEDLICYPEKVINDITEHCELPEKEVMLKNVNVPSAVTTQSEDDSINLMLQNSEIRRKLITKWRDQVSSDQIKTYYKICEKMDLNIYTERIDMPNLKHL